MSEETNGSGAIVLLISSRAHTRCGGRGWIEPDARAPEAEAPTPPLEVPAPEPETGRGSRSRGKQGRPTREAVAVAEVISRTYDAQGRLVRETWGGGGEMKPYVLSETGSGTDDDPTDGGPDGEDSAD